jgi:hypothetical protein
MAAETKSMPRDQGSISPEERIKPVPRVVVDSYPLPPAVGEASPISREDAGAAVPEAASGTSPPVLAPSPPSIDPNLRAQFEEFLRYIERREKKRSR